MVTLQWYDAFLDHQHSQSWNFRLCNLLCNCSWGLGRSSWVILSKQRTSHIWDPVRNCLPSTIVAFYLSLLHKTQELVGWIGLVQWCVKWSITGSTKIDSISNGVEWILQCNSWADTSHESSSLCSSSIFLCVPRRKTKAS